MRLQKTLYDISNIFGKDTQVYLGVELTKLYENNIRGTVKELLAKSEELDLPLKGELTLVVDGKILGDEEIAIKAVGKDLNREINVIEAIKHIHSLAGLTDKQLKSILKSSFSCNNHEIQKIMDEVVYKDKRREGIDPDKLESIIEQASKKMEKDYYKL